jgi:probable lipoprotein NlpC
MKINLHIPLRRFCLFGFLFFASSVFAAVPIQERSLNGAAAADARLKLLAAAESFLGIPYRYGGVDRRGLDCSGLVYLSFREGLGITVPRTADNLYNWIEKIPTQELAPGDLVFFVTAGQTVSHVGIFAGDGTFLHSASEGPHTGVMYSHLDESYWARAFMGAGRALPWDKEAAQAMAAARPEGSVPAGSAHPANSGWSFKPASNWADPGFFVGFGAAWTWGGFIEGAPSPFRGISALATAGYKWPTYRAGLELRSEWDRALGVFRLPFTLSVGTDIFQLFGGAAFTFGDPRLDLSDGERDYSGGRTWSWEVGLAAAIPPVRIARGALSFYGELAWQTYQSEDGKFNFRPDVTANFRVSTGLRYLWHL